MRLQNDDGTYLDGYVYSMADFMKECFYNFLLSSLAVQSNTPLATAHLESCGFHQVTVTRRTNAHNGRKHVWMVDAVKL